MKRFFVDNIIITTPTQWQFKSFTLKNDIGNMACYNLKLDKSLRSFLFNDVELTLRSLAS